MHSQHVHIKDSAKDSNQCPFCTLDPSRIFATNDYAVAVLDGYPVSPGHTLIIPKRHIVSLFEASGEERTALFDLLAEVRERLLDPLRSPIGKEGSSIVPDGFNIGINDGVAAGQSVMHLHIHLIPRYSGDCDDPRGGVRWVFPEHAAYWKKLTKDEGC